MKPETLRAEKMRRMRPLAMAVADGLSGHTSRRGDHADRGAVLRRPQPALAHIGESRAGRLRSGRLREITDERTISDLVADACCSRRCF
jgi:serine/threonine protein phosphatase PrpC